MMDYGDIVLGFRLGCTTMLLIWVSKAEKVAIAGSLVGFVFTLQVLAASCPVTSLLTVVLNGNNVFTGALGRIR